MNIPAKWKSVFLSMILIFIAVSIQAEEIKIGAGAAPSENVFKRIQEPLEKSTGLKLVLIDNGPYEALVELDKGTVQAASGGLAFGDWMKMMDEKGYPISDKGAYKNRVIGKDIVKVIANKDVAVAKLSKEQLKGIFTGKHMNWKEVGGPDKPIVVVSGSKIPGTQAVFRKQIMDEENYAAKVLEATNAPDVKEKVKATPGAVGLAPLTLVDAATLVPEIPEVGRPITLITKGEPSPAMTKMLDFIRGEGKKYLPN